MSSIRKEIKQQQVDFSQTVESSELEELLSILPEELDFVQSDSDLKDAQKIDRPGLPASVNSTAYRIFKMLTWLNDGPLSVDTLNDKFLNEPRIAKAVSSDSIWLYINTLKALGCHIRRPMPSNDFCYELVSHPFGLFLQPQHLDLFIQTKRFLEDVQQRDTILGFDSFLNKIINHSSLLERERFKSALYNKTRSVDYQENYSVIQTLKEAISASELIQVSYLSPSKGKETLYFLPDDLLYQHGALYVLGYQSGRPDGAILRVDRIEKINLIHRPEVHKKLMNQRQSEQCVEIRFYNVKLNYMPQFGLKESIACLEVPNPENINQLIQAIDVTVTTRHFFFLRQKILESGLLFRILSPKHFADSILIDLSQMRQLYDVALEGDE